MSVLKDGDSFPESICFSYVPPTGQKNDIAACGIAVQYDASKEFKNKKVVLVGVPGAFTPTCQERHLTSYMDKASALKAKGVDDIIVISVNDHWVMSAWGKANGIFDDTILFMSDVDQAFSKSIGWSNGPRPKRYAILIDHGKITYAETDEVRGSVEKSGAEAILAKL